MESQGTQLLGNLGLLLGQMGDMLSQITQNTSSDTEKNSDTGKIKHINYSSYHMYIAT